ncbi:MAG: twin-arginine translocation signal domain-containing protein [Thermoguttaceae bacterium]|nr:twin-arginine translocation signal domain-containing protein [Thermoguttaceae bacterium]
MSTPTNRRRFLTALGAAGAALALGSPRLSLGETNPRSRQVFDDLEFARGFKVVDGAGTLGVLRLPVPGSSSAPRDASPSWALAQHNSRYDLTRATLTVEENRSIASTPGQRVALERTPSGELVLALEVATNNEYLAPRKNGEPWIHLLLVQDLPPERAVAIGEIDSLVFSCDARVRFWERLMSETQFDSAIHATQTSVYFVITNANPDSPDYRDYIWFGISFFDDRYEVQSQYVEIDGDPRTIGTGKLIYRLGDQKTIDDLMSGVNPYSLNWVRVELDIAKRVDDMLAAARERGMLTQTKRDDLKLVHLNFGWETPGTYRSALEIKNLSLVATYR